jgi:hypothetical protein
MPLGSSPTSVSPAGSARGLLFLRHRRREGEHGASARIVRYGYLAAMRFHDLPYDRKAQTRTLRFWSLAAPKPVKNSFTVRQRHAGPMVGDAYGAVPRNTV